MNRSVPSIILTLASILGVAMAGCEEPALHDSQDPADIVFGKPVEETVAGIASDQAGGLGEATATIKRAYAYKGYTYLEPDEGSKLVAVDVVFTGIVDAFDLDDVDIIDGISNENFGSGPHVELMSVDGIPIQNPIDDEWGLDGEPMRVLLIYSVPETTKSVKLGYWGSEFNPEAAIIGDSGPMLEKPVE